MQKHKSDFYVTHQVVCNSIAMVTTAWASCPHCPAGIIGVILWTL